MRARLHKLRHLGAPRRVAQFSVVGGVGFCVDAAVLTVLVNGFGWQHYVARVLAFSTAVTCTWYANRRWVFKTAVDARTEYGRYVLVQLVGAAINLGTYVAVIESVPALARLPVVPLAIGSALALLFNYTAATRLAFRRGTRQ